MTDRPLDTPEEATQRLFREFSAPSETLDMITEETGGDRVEAIAQITHIMANGFAQHFPPGEYYRSWHQYAEQQRTEAVNRARQAQPEAGLDAIIQEPEVQILTGISRGLFTAMKEARRDPWPWQVSFRSRR